MKYFTGIGSRSTPNFICRFFTLIAKELSPNYTLRSGGADGADIAFENGAGDNKQIWLPWKNFNKNSSNFILDDRATQLLKTIIDANHFSRLSVGALKLQSRNMHQILGHLYDDELTSFVLCWTKDAEDVGGTASAIKLARSLQIPVYNFGKCKTIDEAEQYWQMVKILENID